MTHNQVYYHLREPLIGGGRTGLKWFRLHTGDPGELGTANMVSGNNGINKRLAGSSTYPLSFGAEVTVYESATVTHCSLWDQIAKRIIFTCKYDTSKVIAQDNTASLEILLNINIQITA